MLNKKTKIAVVFGGNSTEYEISLRSVEFVLNNLNSDRYDVVKIGITKDGKWLLYNGNIEKIKENTWFDEKSNKKVMFSPDTNERRRLIIVEEDKSVSLDIDIVFPVLHGINGEDGAVQGIFELSRLPFVGCGVLASAICMDKITAHAVLDAAAIKTAKYVPLYEKELRDLNAAKNLVLEKLEFPLYVKPSRQGSSIGISKANNEDELIKALETAKSFDDRVLVEESLVGQEIECAVMGNNDPVASKLGEIITSTEFYDYASKYTNDSAKTIIPAKVSNDIAKKVQAIAIDAYRKTNCKGLARVDFFVLKNNDIVLNEINTLPGFTSISMFPKLLMSDGKTAQELLDTLVLYALERK